MEDHPLSKPLTPKLYKDRTIYIGTLLGGPLVAGYLVAENFKVFGEQDKIKITWAISIVATIVIFSAIFLIPDVDKIPRFIIPLAYSAIAQSLVKKYQGAIIQQHLDKGAKAYSGWRAAWIGLVGAIILMALLLPIVLLVSV